MCFIHDLALPDSGTISRRTFLGTGLTTAAAGVGSLLLPGLAEGAEPAPRGGGPHDYNGRLLRALGNPKRILPTHWENFDRPLSEPPQDARDRFGDNGNVDLWVKDVKRLSPKSKLVMLKYFESYAA